MYLNGLDGKRVEAAHAAHAARVQAAFDKASMPEATQEDIDNAEKMRIEYLTAIGIHEASEKKKKKKGIKGIITAYEKTFKIVGKIDPTFKIHAKSVERRKRLDSLKIEGMKLQGEKPSEERDKKLTALSAEMQSLAKKEKKYLKQGKIVALIASIVIGIFTFGGGTVAIQSAYQALKAGAIEVAKKLLISAALSAAAKGAMASDVKKAKQAALDLEKYPPDPNLPTFEAMMKDSQLKKQAATEKTASILIPAGIIAAITFFT